MIRLNAKLTDHWTVNKRNDLSAQTYTYRKFSHSLEENINYLVSEQEKITKSLLIQTLSVVFKENLVVNVELMPLLQVILHVIFY